MELEEHFTMFNNALRILASGVLGIGTTDARQAISLIEHEWAKRRNRSDTTYHVKSTSEKDLLCEPAQSTWHWPAEGMLSVLGYHVGNTNGQPKQLRQAILTQIYQGELPPVCSASYMAQWGAPRSAQRLYKLLVTLIAFAKNESKLSPQNYCRAIRERLEDIEFLKSRYHAEDFTDVGDIAA
jgi:hypothetical protein